MTVARTLQRAIFTVTCTAALTSVAVPPGAASASSFPAARSQHASAPRSGHGPWRDRRTLAPAAPAHDRRKSSTHMRPASTLRPGWGKAEWSGSGVAANGYWVVNRGRGCRCGGGSA